MTHSLPLLMTRIVLSNDGNNQMFSSNSLSRQQDKTIREISFTLRVGSLTGLMSKRLRVETHGEEAEWGKKVVKAVNDQVLSLRMMQFSK